MVTSEKNTEDNIAKDKNSPLRETKVGIWTMYFAPQTSVPKDSIPSLGLLDQFYSLRRAVPLALVWRFVLDAISIGPAMFALYLASSTASSLVPVLQLENNGHVLDLVSRVESSGYYL
jgi:hypothetical protein